MSKQFVYAKRFLICIFLDKKKGEDKYYEEQPSL